MKATRKHGDSHVWHFPCRDCGTTVTAGISLVTFTWLNAHSDIGPVCADCSKKPAFGMKRERWHGWDLMAEATMDGQTSVEV